MFARRRLRTFATDTRGSTAIEYGLIAALIVIASIAALKNLANANTGMWNNVSNEVVGNRS